VAFTGTEIGGRSRRSAMWVAVRQTETELSRSGVRRARGGIDGTDLLSAGEFCP